MDGVLNLMLFFFNSVRYTVDVLVWSQSCIPELKLLFHYFLSIFAFAFTNEMSFSGFMLKHMLDPQNYLKIIFFLVLWAGIVLTDLFFDGWDKTQP